MPADADGSAAARLGACSAVLGLLQAWSASHWLNTFGTVLGMAGILVGVGLILAAQLAGVEPTSPSKTRRRQREGFSLQAAARGAATALTVYLGLLVLVRLASGDPPSAGFPEACPAGKQLGCARVAEAAPHRDGGVQPARLRASLAEVRAAVLAWLAQEPRTHVLWESASADGSRPGASLHARAVSVVMGYADDLHLGWRCDLAAGEVVVEAQSQLRIGVGDMEVNPRRVRRLMEWLQAEAAAGRIEPGRCGPGGGGEGSGGA